MDIEQEVYAKRRSWNDVLLSPRLNFQPRLLYLAKLSCKIEGEIKTSNDKYKIKEFMNT
jgi:hypothetical protein